MKTKFFLDRLIGKSIGIIFAAYLLVMIGIALLNGRFFENAILFGIVGGLIVLSWLILTYGVYIIIDGNTLQVTRVFFRGKIIDLFDVVSIHQKPIFAGLVMEVYMKVRKKDGTFYEQGLINKPGLNESEYDRLLKKILSINQNIKIDKLLSK
jgi:hypothetical protein